MPKVSVIVPVYGVENFIERCARSLFEQTLDDIEFIFINDCTKDNSIEILNKTIKDYPHRKQQIRIENMPTNSGLAAVRRHGTQLATGDYIIHCDSDDWIDNDMLDKMYQKIKATNADIVMVDVYKELLDYRYLINAPYSNNKKEIISAFIRGNAIYQWNKLIKKELYIKYLPYLKEGFDMSEDYSIIVPLSMGADKIEYVPNTYYHYTQYNNNAITKKKVTQKEINGWLRSVECVVDYTQKNNINDYESDIIYRKLMIKYWCILRTRGELQKKISNIYPEINIHIRNLMKEAPGRRAQLLFYTVIKGYTNCFNLLLRLGIIKII